MICEKVKLCAELECLSLQLKIAEQCQQALQTEMRQRAEDNYKQLHRKRSLQETTEETPSQQEQETGRKRSRHSSNQNIDMTAGQNIDTEANIDHNLPHGTRVHFTAEKASYSPPGSTPIRTVGKASYLHPANQQHCNPPWKPAHSVMVRYSPPEASRQQTVEVARHSPPTGTQHCNPPNTETVNPTNNCSLAPGRIQNGHNDKNNKRTEPPNGGAGTERPTRPHNKDDHYKFSAQVLRLAPHLLQGLSAGAVLRQRMRA